MAARWSAAALYPPEVASYSFLSEAKSTPGPSVAGRSRLIKKYINLVRIRARDLPTCNMVLEPTTLPRGLFPKRGSYLIELQFV
jgi:hypothetical protein